MAYSSAGRLSLLCGRQDLVENSDMSERIKIVVIVYSNIWYFTGTV